MSDLNSLRRLSFSVAYRMLGSVVEAEDIVQDALLRFHNASNAGTSIESREAYLTSITTRLAIDHLRSARVRRETYVGEWLPEPVIQSNTSAQLERVESISMAFLLLLETLTPTERAVFLLREVFEYDYSEIARIVEKAEDNCRQIFARAKRRVEEGKPRFEPSLEERDQLAEKFFDACRAGELAGLEELLAQNVTCYSDGGGKVVAAVKPVHGRDKVARFLQGILKKGRDLGGFFRPAVVNGNPGAIAVDKEGRLVNVVELEIADGAIQALRIVVNPEKLQHLGEPSPVLQLHARHIG
jgi:RNA polymerase sigma-70 factor (ECF subfamily)